jgi:hypothetical protein
MSDFRDILDRAQTDYDFYLTLLRDPAEALLGYTLSAEERDLLTSNRTALWRFILGGEVVRLPERGGGVSEEGPPSEGPPSEGPPSEGPPSEGPPSEGPPSEGPPSEGPPSEGPPSEGHPAKGPRAKDLLTLASSAWRARRRKDHRWRARHPESA